MNQLIPRPQQIEKITKLVTKLPSKSKSLSPAHNFNLNKVFSNFQATRKTMHTAIHQNGYDEYKSIYMCNNPLLDFFNTHFPNISKARAIGTLSNADFKHWDAETDKSQQNHIGINSGLNKDEWDQMASLVPTENAGYDFVSIGGPSAFISNHLHQMNDKLTNKTNGSSKGPKTAHYFLSRNDSNFDGSAHYFHERDAFPVYVNKVNRGPYCIFIDLAKRIRCMMSKDKFIKYAEDNPGFVKINVNWTNMIKKPSIIWNIFLKNFYLMAKNVYGNGKDLNNCLLHAQATPAVVDRFADNYNNISFDDLLILDKAGRDEHKAIYVNIDENYECSKHFKWLNDKFGKIPFNIWDKKQMTKYGFNLDYIKEILCFPKDGQINPNFFKNLQKCFTNEMEENWMVKNIYYSNDKAVSNDEVICKLEHPNNQNQVKYIRTKKLSLSLGPSAEYKLNNKSIVNPYMYASGTSSVVMMAVKASGDAEKEDVADKFVKKCSLFIDSVNQHWTPIEIKKNIQIQDPEANSEDKYHLIAMQMTGGGNFPSRHIRPDIVLNLLSNCEKIFGLKEFENNNDIFYDIVQLRGCGRGVTANNSINFVGLNKNNICITYGLGGIGMTTMFANAELINQILYNKNNTDKDGKFVSSGPLKHINYKSMVKILKK